MGESILKIKDLYYTYGDGTIALNGVNVEIKEGEKIAVIGSNGAGKSTFFLTANGVLKPDQGEISYRGTIINKKNLKELRKNIGIIFQDADNQIIASTVMSEVGFGPMNLKLPKEEVLKRVEESLIYMNLMDYKDRPPHYLSGGEKKRVTIADIIAMRSEIIVFDEPTAGLDPLNAQIFEDVLGKLGSEGKTILISTHDVDFVYRWAERAIVFCHGEIIADGTPLEIFQNDEILKQANLKRPTMMEVYDVLVERHLLEDTKAYPVSIQALKEMLGNNLT